MMSLDPRLVVPYVTEQSPRGERTMDIYSRLLADRIIFIGMPVDDQVANVVMAQLLHLDSEDPEQDINLYINSPGGSVYAGMAIYDTMRFVNCDVATTALGMAASMGAFLLAAGTKGKRSALPNTRGNERLGERPGQRFDKPGHDTAGDYMPSAEQAVGYGAIDQVVNRPGE